MMNRICVCTFVFACVLSARMVHGQTIFDVPQQCSVALKQDLSHIVSSTSERLAYLGIIKKEDYEKFTQDIKDAATIPIEGVPVENSADFNKFDEQRHEFYNSMSYNYDEVSALDLLSQTTSARAYQSFDACMKTLAMNQQGFYAWRVREDQNDLQFGCQYHSPPAASFADHVVHPIEMKITITEGGIFSDGKTIEKQTLGAFDSCSSVMVRRTGHEKIVVTFSGGGYNSVIVSSVAPPPDGNAIISYVPKKTVDEVVVQDQTQMQPPISNGTVNMDGRGGCRSPIVPMACDPVTGTHEAWPLTFWFWPPTDGDNYDPNTSPEPATPRDVGGQNGSLFCDVFQKTYQLISGVPPPGQAPQQWIDFIAARQGKHLVTVVTRCWSHPVLWNVSVKAYHIVDDNANIYTATTTFKSNEDFILSLPTGITSKIQLSYAQKQDIVAAGSDSSDGKVKCEKTFEFAGRTFYVYRYTA